MATTNRSPRSGPMDYARPALTLRDGVVHGSKVIMSGVAAASPLAEGDVNGPPVQARAMDPERRGGDAVVSTVRSPFESSMEEAYKTWAEFQFSR